MWLDHEHVLWLNAGSYILLMPAHLWEVSRTLDQALGLSSESLQKRGTCDLPWMQFVAYPQSLSDFLEINGMNCLGIENECGRGKGRHGNRSVRRTVSWGIVNKIKISAFFFCTRLILGWVLRGL